MERISHVPMRGRVRERCQTQWGEAILFEPRREDIFRTEVIRWQSIRISTTGLTAPR